MKRQLLLLLLCLLLPLLAACGAEPAEILLTPLEESAVEIASPPPVVSVTVRTPFGSAVAAELPEPARTEAPHSRALSDMPAAETAYVLNTSSRRFHDPSCASVAEMKASNRQDFNGTRDELIAMGYKPCGRCKP